MKLPLLLVSLPLISAVQNATTIEPEIKPNAKDFCEDLGKLSANPTWPEIEDLIEKLVEEDHTYLTAKLLISPLISQPSAGRNRLERICQTSPSVIRKLQLELDESIATIENNLDDLKTRGFKEESQDSEDIISTLNMNDPVPESDKKSKLMNLKNQVSQLLKDETEQKLARATTQLLEKVINLVWAPVRLLSELENSVAVVKSVFNNSDVKLVKLPNYDGLTRYVDSLRDDFELKKDVLLYNVERLEQLQQFVTGLKTDLKKLFVQSIQNRNLTLLQLEKVDKITENLQLYLTHSDLQPNVKYAAEEFEKISTSIGTLVEGKETFSVEKYIETLDEVEEACASGKEFSYVLFKTLETQTRALESEVSKASPELQASSKNTTDIVNSIIDRLKKIAVEKKFTKKDICQQYEKIEALFYAYAKEQANKAILDGLNDARWICRDESDSANEVLNKLVTDFKEFFPKHLDATKLKAEVDKLKDMLSKTS